ncbi:MAG: sulfotransferase domain-containing protein [Clostridiales bacterium]|nr:sulfotransferase domain-containing protein [Clostridiales bacterium]
MGYKRTTGGKKRDMGYPDFVCMGFQKCGTTTLYDILKQHPQIALCRDVKEPMYYRIPFIDILGGGKLFYRKRYFGHLDPEDTRLKGEINAGLTFNGCERKLNRDMPKDAKMIFMMRNPVTRSYSAYKYFLARGFLPASYVEYDEQFGHTEGFDYYVHSVLDDPRKRKRVMKKRQTYLVLSQSNYAACISEYLQDFDIENMKFVIFEEFIKDQQAACRDIYDFLGIDDAPGIDYNVKSNETNERTVSSLRSKYFMVVKGCNYAMHDLLSMTHWAPKVFVRFRKYYRSVRSKCMIVDKDKSKVMPKTYEYLMQYFDADIRKLEKITGRDLRSIWNCSTGKV